MADKDKLIKVAKELNELYKSKKAALPYSINVIRELHANENANSRILRGLLQYSHNGQYPVLQSFIERLKAIADCPIDISIQNPELTNEQDNRIDLLIKEKKSFFRFIAVPAKWVRTARQYKLNIYSNKPYKLIWEHR